MTTFTELDHPRGHFTNAGSFSEKTQTAPEATLALPSDKALAADPSTQPEMLTIIAEQEDNDWTVGLALANNPSSPDPALRALAESDETRTRCGVAEHANASADTLSLLVNDQTRDVRVLVAAHPNLAVSDQAWMARDEDIFTQNAIASRQKLDPLVFEALLTSRHQSVKTILAGRPEVSTV